MAHQTDEELERLLREVQERYPEAVAAAARLRERAERLEPIPVTIQVGSERPAEDAIVIAQARLDAVITGYGEGRFTMAEVNIARKQMALCHARRPLAAIREQLEAEGVRWEDVPDDDEWTDMLSA